MQHDFISAHDIAEPNIYNKLPVTINAQIDILTTRGMLITNIPLARKFLQENYFHRFISYSVVFFESKTINNSKKYIPGTTFEQVLDVYNFDSFLRELILHSIEKIEISIKTRFVELSHKYGAHFYLNHKHFKDHKLLNDSIERIQYQLKMNHELLVDSYCYHYNDPLMPPVWSAMEMVSIGQLGKWILNLKRVEDRQAVAEHYKLHYTVLQAVVDNLTLIRNNAAHHARIWNQHYEFIECVDAGHHELICDVLSRSNGKIYGVLALILHILTVLDDAHIFLDKLSSMIQKYDINVNEMGFPANWQNNFLNIIKYAK